MITPIFITNTIIIMSSETTVNLRMIRMIRTSRMSRMMMVIRMIRMIRIIILPSNSALMTEDGAVILQTHHDMVVYPYVDKHYTQNVVDVHRDVY